MATCPILLKSLSKLKLLVTIDFKTKVIGNFNNFTYLYKCILGIHKELMDKIF